MKNGKKSEKNINALDGAALSDMVHTFLWEKGHRDTLQASDKMAREWFQGDVILEKEDFSDEFEYLLYYSELAKVPVLEIVREALADWIECSYPARIGSFEEKLGISSTLEPESPQVSLGGNA
jgi:hypothetical protein